jgi:hypothetical protein
LLISHIRKCDPAHKKLEADLNKVPVDLGDDGICNRYGRKFPKHPPPAMAWHGEPAALEALMEQSDPRRQAADVALSTQGARPQGRPTRGEDVMTGTVQNNLKMRLYGTCGMGRPV